MSAAQWKARASKLFRVRASGSGWVIEGAWGGFANTVSAAFVMENGDAIRDEIADALRDAYEMGLKDACGQRVSK